MRRTPAWRRLQPKWGLSRLWLSVVTLAALSLAGCTSGHARPRPTTIAPTATITPLPASPLIWQPVTLPPGFAADHPATSALAVAPSNGNVAYACFEPDGASTPTTQLWVTRDRAATWTPLALPVTAGSISWCSLLVDAANPQTVVVGVSMLTPSLSNRYNASFDGGSSWQDLALPPNVSLASMASYDSATYALENIATISGTTTSLVVSTDHLHSWRAIDKSLTTLETEVTGFWVNSATGALLAQVSTSPLTPSSVATPGATASPTASATAQSSSRQTTLWLSVTAGVNWSRTQAPVAAQVITQQPATGQTWRLCVTQSDPTGVAQNRLACSADGGKTWQTLAALSIPYTCKTCTIPTGSESIRVAPATVFALPTDSAILAISPDWYGSRSEIKGYGVYRLTPGAMQWQSLGPAPQPGIQSGQAGASTVIWALPTAHANIDPQARVFIAMYPS